MEKAEKKPVSGEEAKRAYQKAWRAKNRERVKEYNRRYWERVAEKQRECESEGASNG